MADEEELDLPKTTAPTPQLGDSGGDAARPWLPLAAIAVALFAVGVALGGRAPSGAMLALGLVHAGVLGLRPRWAPALLVVDLGLAGWQSAHEATASFQWIYDSWVHMALARRVVDFGPFPPHPFYVEHGAAPLYSIVHLVQGGASALLGVPVTDVWRWSHPTVVVGIGAAGYFAHRELLRRESAALLAGLACVVVFRFAWGYAAYPRVVGPSLGLLALGFAFRALRTRRLAPGIGAGVALGLAFASHPISGGLAALVLGPILAVELAGAMWRGEALRDSLRLSAAIVGVSVAVASPWLVADVVAWMNRLPGVAATPEGGFSGFVLAKLALRLGHAAWPWLPIGAVVAGLLAALARPRDRLVGTYLAVASFVGGVLPLSLFGGQLADVLGREYAMRLIEVFPLPAFFGLAFTAFDHPALRARWIPRVVGLAAAAGCVSLLLFDLAPWEKSPDRTPVPGRLLALEPILRDRVVVAPPLEAYQLPALTGAFVAWNGVDSHGNRWVYDGRRKVGAERILAGRLGPEPGETHAGRWTDFMEDYRVELVVLPRKPSGPHRSLMATGRFTVLDEAGGYVVLEYQAEGGRARAVPRSTP